MRSLLAAAVALELGACGAPSAEVEVDAAAELTDGSPEVSFATLSRDIIAPRCSGVSCHSDGAVLSFAKQTAVVGAPARSAECAGVGDIVVPFEPAESLLYTKLTAAPCGSMMPLSVDPMPLDEIEAIRAWIASGAP